jgi:transcription elongation factor Elf1
VAVQVKKLGRRRKRIIKAPKKGLPKVFSCPKCGEESVRVVISRDNHVASVICGNQKCAMSTEVPVSNVEQAVDAYCKFADMYHSGKLA